MSKITRSARSLLVVVVALTATVTIVGVAPANAYTGNCTTIDYTPWNNFTGRATNADGRKEEFWPSGGLAQRRAAESA
jgi:hypothetical protein